MDLDNINATEKIAELRDAYKNLINRMTGGNKGDRNV
jgi:hypothetical protein